ncbi:hypothetical protein FQN60_012561 [Etheostoma spectabile]|uniref:Uncharacterized protein n=1 Tax=Etheostoma spectabile TaxID=54343 RepID=A0A5J5DQ02_9PERO|nr:hypothetical protein FQN60_012561 [Etheostoma spectabile]
MLLVSLHSPCTRCS